MKFLVIGSGGREHALCWTLAASPLCESLYCAPGNPGIAEDAVLVDIGVNDIDALVRFAVDEKIDLVVVGPEEPLVNGLADAMRAAGIKTVGPSAEAARLEGSKGYMKDICRKYGIPTAAYTRVDSYAEAEAFIQDHGAPIVVKTDGLAAGKGVTVAMTIEEALAAAQEALEDGKFGAAGRELVIEEFLEGEELSYFALCDGDTALPLASAQDHKRAYDGDQGPNTGGMGAYSPAPVCTDAVEKQIIDTILNPTLAAMKAEGSPFQGVLFLGVMVTDEGPKLIEYNIRFGDPECQAILMRLMSDLAPALLACADGVLSNFDLRWYEETALTVVMASKGYPGAYEKGTPITLPDPAGPNGAPDPDVVTFHAGTTLGPDGGLAAAGGRVLNVTARGHTVAEAQARAYAEIARIDWPNGFWRRDIGWRAVERENALANPVSK
ncbi:MAG: phosphoribosylamine--glycine ligase [Alphaproteobacteria bacterium]|nr:phosphoribosylamine--glycine ligase [Alphaproteobacteria bacterium]